MPANVEVTDPILVPISEAARLLSCSASLVKLMIRRGEIRTVKLGRLTRIPRAHLEELFSRSEESGENPLALPPSRSPESAHHPPEHRRVGALTRRRRGWA
jgi:excisionase family DNA binding protein